MHGPRGGGGYECARGDKGDKLPDESLQTLTEVCDVKSLKGDDDCLGVVEIFFGLGFTFFMNEMGKTLGFEPGPDYLLYIGALLGLTLITISGFIISAARNPLQYIGWVRFAIWWCIAV